MSKPLQKERENRSAEKKDLTFHPYNITPESAHTAILLLEAKEPEIICQTLRAITKFSAQDMQNRIQIYNLEGIKYILPHIEHPEINIKRFALKALAQLLQLPKGPEQVLVNQQNLRKVAFLLAKMEDVFVQEFASLVLAELTREPVGCEQLVSANILSSLFSRMKNSLDPDVQKNCLQTLCNMLADPVCATEVTKNNQFSLPSLLGLTHYATETLCNMLADPVCATEVTKNNQFSWPSLLALMQSPYLAIQHAAIKTVDQLICRYKDQAVQKSFRASTGVLDLCDILESYEFRDVHAEVLSVLRNYVETEENAAHVYQSGCILRLLAYLEMAMPNMKPPCLSVLTKMSFTQNGRQALFDTGTDLVFCHQLLGTNAECLADSAMGVANMTKLLPSAIRMCDTNIIEALGAILADEQAPWFFVRINAFKALVELCRIIPKAAYATIEPKLFGTIRSINKKFKENPIEAQRLAVQCFSSLLSYHESTKAMLNADFMQDLLHTMTRPDILLKIMTANVLIGLMAEDICKYIFTLRKGEEVVSENLQIEHIGLRTALCSLIAASVTEEAANAYLELGTIHFMVNNRNARYVVSAWEAALEAIFRHHPSAKFAYYGHLDINDFTSEGFYVLKHLGEVFPSLHEVANRPPPHRDPVFACFFYPTTFEHPDSSYDIRTPHRTSKSLLAMPHSATRMRLSSMPDDVNLRDYVVKLKIWLGDPSKSLQYIEIGDAHYDVRYREKCSEVSTSLKEKAHLIGEFVAEQMCGVTQERDCSMPSVDLHLADLMRELHSPVIGLGWVRCGSALERAVLYKVLADRVGLPCALYRAPSAHAWVEIAVPEPDEDELDTPSKYPAGLLRANYVVDLIHRPGHLAPLGSYEAQRITGGQSERYVARKITPICKCPQPNEYYCKKEKIVEEVRVFDSI